jgi:hypothetical protein
MNTDVFEYLELLQSPELFLYLPYHDRYKLFFVSVFPGRVEEFAQSRNSDIPSLSFLSTDDGFFEEAQYRYNSNPADPRCITAFILWQHGRYQLNNNGSLTLYPFSADGRIQVQDPCAAVTNLITYYDQTVRFDFISSFASRGKMQYELT